MRKLLFLILLLPVMVLAKPVKYGELYDALSAVQYYCTASYCYARVFYYFIDKTQTMVYCTRLINQPISPTVEWTGLYDYTPQANMTSTPLSQAEMEWCKQ